MLAVTAKILPTVLICIALAVIVGLIIFSLISDKKKGRNTCGAQCAHCAMAGTCHGHKKSKGKK